MQLQKYKQTINKLLQANLTLSKNKQQFNKFTVHYFGFWQEDKGPSFCQILDEKQGLTHKNHNIKFNRLISQHATLGNSTLMPPPPIDHKFNLNASSRNPNHNITPQCQMQHNANIKSKQRHINFFPSHANLHNANNANNANNTKCTINATMQHNVKNKPNHLNAN